MMTGHHHWCDTITMSSKMQLNPNVNWMNFNFEWNSIERKLGNVTCFVYGHAFQMTHLLYWYNRSEFFFLDITYIKAAFDKSNKIFYRIMFVLMIFIAEQNVLCFVSRVIHVINLYVISSLKLRCLPTIWSKVALKFPRWCFIFIQMIFTTI